MQVYINYPKPHFTVHKNASCPQIHLHNKAEQRIVIVNPASLKRVLTCFIKNAYDFRAEASWNDLWLDISLSTPEQEIGLVHIVQALLGQRYKPLSTAPINIHCE